MSNNLTVEAQRIMQAGKALATQLEQHGHKPRNYKALFEDPITALNEEASTELTAAKAELTQFEEQLREAEQAKRALVTTALEAAKSSKHVQKSGDATEEEKQEEQLAALEAQLAVQENDITIEELTYEIARAKHRVASAETAVISTRKYIANFECFQLHWNGDNPRDAEREAANQARLEVSAYQTAGLADTARSAALSKKNRTVGQISGRIANIRAEMGPLQEKKQEREDAIAAAQAKVEQCETAVQTAKGKAQAKRNSNDGTTKGNIALRKAELNQAKKERSLIDAKIALAQLTKRPEAELESLEQEQEKSSRLVRKAENQLELQEAIDEMQTCLEECVSKIKRKSKIEGKLFKEEDFDQLARDLWGRAQKATDPNQRGVRSVRGTPLDDVTGKENLDAIVKNFLKEQTLSDKGKAKKVTFDDVDLKGIDIPLRKAFYAKQEAGKIR